jgi:hypothetical protein
MRTEDARRLVESVFDEVEQDLFFAIKTIPDNRPFLLAELDVISRAKERASARFDSIAATA